MENGHVEVSFNERFSQNSTENVVSCRNQYGIPEHFNPADHPEVKMRNPSSADRSETQRKRRSKNRLSNRRSTGFVNPDVIEQAMQLGPTSNEQIKDN